MAHADTQPIAIVIPSVAGGGAERVWLDLATALLARGHTVDVVLLSLKGQYQSIIPADGTIFCKASLWNDLRLQHSLNQRGQLRTIPFAGFSTLSAWRRFRRHWPDSRKRLCTLELTSRAEFLRRYIEDRNPRAVLSATTGANCPTIMASLSAECKPFVCVSVHNNVARGYSAKDTARARLLYPHADLVAGVSQGVAECAKAHFGLSNDRTRCVYNGVPIQKIETQSRDTRFVDLSSFDRNNPTLLSAMRLSRRPGGAKDHVTLLKAFALVRESVDVRLALVGVGQQKAARRKHFLRLASDLGVSEYIDFLGFHENHFPYMARATVLVHSSRWEGLPTVLLEAMACGTPVVSTDSPFGPAEILDGGKFGQLVPVEDQYRLAEAIKDTLAGKHPPSNVLKRRAEDFSLERMAENYETLCKIPKA